MENTKCNRTRLGQGSDGQIGKKEQPGALRKEKGRRESGCGRETQPSGSCAAISASRIGRASNLGKPYGPLSREPRAKQSAALEGKPSSDARRAARLSAA